MSDKVNVIKRKALKQAMQQYYDQYTLAAEMYNIVLYDHQFDLMENALTYHMNIMNDLKETFNLIEPLEESIDMLDIENCFFKSRTERLILDNYYALQELRELYKELEHQYYTLKIASVMDGDVDDDD